MNLFLFKENINKQSRYRIKNLKKMFFFAGLKGINWIFIFCILSILGYPPSTMGNEAAYDTSQIPGDHQLQLQRLYNQILPAENKPSYEVFFAGMKGYHSIAKEGKLQNRRYLTLIDFSLSSTSKRLWVIDLESMQVIHHSLVSHGKNTGNEYAVKFSNKPHSYMSSLGFYVTGKTYTGKHGLSLYLEGIEKEINDNAKKRAVVIHGANYASQKFIAAYGRLGRSLGCPALPTFNYKQIIDTIKGKSCLFIYYPDKDYFYKSTYANSAQ